MRVLTCSMSSPASFLALLGSEHEEFLLAMGPAVAFSNPFAFLTSCTVASISSLYLYSALSMRVLTCSASFLALLGSGEAGGILSFS